MARARIGVVGEALLDVVTTPDGASRSHPGGSPANVALTLARLGDPVSLLTDLGRDEAGEQIRAHLEADGVDLGATVVHDAATSVATATVDEAGAATYTFDLRWQLSPDASLPAELTCLHTGSLGTALQPGAAVVRRLVDRLRPRTTISYDPNCRPAVLGDPDAVRADVEAWARRSDVVKVSDEDLAWLYPDRAAEEVVDAWHREGPALVVLTRGGYGVRGVCGAGALDRPAAQVDVVDTVGAGDAFMGALLHGLLEADLLGDGRPADLAAIDLDTVGAVLDQAALVAGLTCSRPGADPPYRAELLAARR